MHCGELLLAALVVFLTAMSGEQQNWDENQTPDPLTVFLLLILFFKFFLLFAHKYVIIIHQHSHYLHYPHSSSHTSWFSL